MFVDALTGDMEWAWHRNMLLSEGMCPFENPYVLLVILQVIYGSIEKSKKSDKMSFSKQAVP
jgi:hypothetical protein